jgi:hypothetical protein
MLKVKVRITFEEPNNACHTYSINVNGRDMIEVFRKCLEFAEDLFDSHDWTLVSIDIADIKQ